MSDSATLSAARVPTVYFIDDSATMREVIKIAFRKENVNVITCPDAASALAQFADSAPDAVITDVIMPDKDGYEVCDFIKHHENFGGTPVILMSGVVNKTVAERAMSVKADELIRKPFHPQDLIGRVKGLLASKFPAMASVAHAPASAPAPVTQPPSSSQVLTNFFAPPPAVPVAARVMTSPDARFASSPNPAVLRMPPQAAPQPNVAPAPSVAAPAASSGEITKLRNEVRRLELLVKKLQTELEASREYCASLEAHVKTMQE
ncbi:MAG TPA: response regulator [Candidatus Acidoferrales bacterium]|nr:response regulator [Candidatus Acidoferrales bacterium]